LRTSYFLRGLRTPQRIGPSRQTPGGGNPFVITQFWDKLCQEFPGSFPQTTASMPYQERVPDKVGTKGEKKGPGYSIRRQTPECSAKRTALSRLWKQFVPGVGKKKKIPWGTSRKKKKKTTPRLPLAGYAAAANVGPRRGGAQHTSAESLRRLPHMWGKKRGLNLLRHVKHRGPTTGSYGVGP